MLHKALPGHTRHPASNNNRTKTTTPPWATLPCAFPTPKLASRMRLSPFLFPPHPSASPSTLRPRAPTAASTCATPHALATASHVNEVAARGTAKKDFLPARFRAGRLIRCPRRPQLSASFARCPVGESESQEGLSSRSFPRAGHSSPHHARREREPRRTFSRLLSVRPTFTPVHAGHSSPHVRRVAPLTLFFPLHLPSDQKPVASAPCDAHVPCDFLCATSGRCLSRLSVCAASLPKVPHLPETHSCS